jgi:23S rRNA (pseudouridine1915-N3)-methyltransferase
MIKIMCVGKLNQKYLNEGISYYMKQIPEKIEFIEIQDESSIHGIDLEGTRILSKIKDSDYVFTLEIEGKMKDSVEFSALINHAKTYQQGDLVFVIGGSYGLSNEVKERSNEKISFSKMTFPHQMMRLILIEQIYRAYMIQKNHPYHK